MSLTTPVAELVFDRRERLAVNYWSDSGTDHFFASYKYSASGESPSSMNWANNESRPEILHKAYCQSTIHLFERGEDQLQREG